MKIVALLTLALLWAYAAAKCRKVTVQEGFNLDSYISAPWYIQEQAIVDFQPIQNFYCVRAQYSRVGRLGRGQTPMGYRIRVNNYAQDAEGNEFGGPLCAYQTNPLAEPAKIAVAPCPAPKERAGPYWVVAYEEGKNGYALVSGGQPTVETKPGLCRTGRDSGLWILTRAQRRNQAVINKVRKIATDKGFDISVLLNVTQNGCVYD